MGSARSYMRVLGSEFYVANLLVLASYALLRHNFVQSDITMSSFNLRSVFASQPQRSSYGTWEWQVLTACAATAAFRVYKLCTSVDATCFTVVGYAQIFVLAMAFLVHKVVFAHYVLAFALIHLLLEHARFDGKCHVELLTPTTFKEKALDPETANRVYLVFLHAAWSLPCRHAYGTFAELSEQYATDRVNFATLDVGEWPSAAHRLGIEVSPTSAHLPSIVLFEHGQEQARLPGRAARANGREMLSKINIIRVFELDMRLATSLQQKGAGK